jgi:hypothetical protein
MKLNRCHAVSAISLVRKAQYLWYKKLGGEVVVVEGRVCKKQQNVM